MNSLSAWLPCGRLRPLAPVALSVLALVLLGAQRASADSSGYVQSAASFSFPSGSQPLNNTGWQQYGASACSANGTCVMVGGYTDVNHHDQAYVVPILGGVPQTAVRVKQPADASTTRPYAELQAVACQADGTCEAYGEYRDNSGQTGPMFVQINDGQPAQAVALNPSSDSVSNRYASFAAISCAPAGPCVAVGKYYSKTTNTDLPLVDTISGAGQQAVAAAVPADHFAGSAEGQLNGVACQSDGSCTAVGYYFDAHDNEAAMVLSIANGTPGTSEPAQPPSGAATTSGGPSTYLDYVGCPASGSCEAIGYYNDTSGDQRTFVVPVTEGLPGIATPVQPPADSEYKEILPYGISCSSATFCVAAGLYYDKSNGYRAVTVNVEPTGAVAQETPLPAGASTPQDAAFYAPEYSNGDPVACVAGGTCLAAGYYSTNYNTKLSAGDAYAGLLVQVSPAGSVSSAGPAAAPADQSLTGPDNVGPYAQPYFGTACVGSGSCVTSGFYYNTPGYWAPYVLSLQVPLSVRSSALPGGSQGVAYSQTLAASGAWGSYSWDLTGGSLPAGLSLNPQTGVISGTPSGSGTSSFTVSVSGTGAPVQTATRQLSISVAASPATTTTTTTTTTATTTTVVTTTTPSGPVAPASVARATVRVLRAGGRLRGGAAVVTLSCAGARCAGTVRLEVRRTFFVRHGKRRVRRHRLVVVGSARFAAGVGMSRHVSVRLNALGRRLLARARHHRLGVEVLALVAGGNGARRHATIWTPVRSRGRKHRRH